MDFEITFSADEGFVRIKVHRSITAGLERDLAEKAIAAAKQNGVLRYLADVRGVSNVASTVDQYDLAYRELTRLGLDRTSRIAVLIMQQDRSHDFIETVFRNAGHDCRLFVKEDDARDWLRR